MRSRRPSHQWIVNPTTPNKRRLPKAIVQSNHTEPPVFGDQRTKEQENTNQKKRQQPGPARWCVLGYDEVDGNEHEGRACGGECAGAGVRGGVAPAGLPAPPEAETAAPSKQERWRCGHNLQSHRHGRTAHAADALTLSRSFKR